MLTDHPRGRPRLALDTVAVKVTLTRPQRDELRRRAALRSTYLSAIVRDAVAQALSTPFDVSISEQNGHEQTREHVR